MCAWRPDISSEQETQADWRGPDGPGLRHWCTGQQASTASARRWRIRAWIPRRPRSRSRRHHRPAASGVCDPDPAARVKSSRLNAPVIVIIGRTVALAGQLDRPLPTRKHITTPWLAPVTISLRFSPRWRMARPDAGASGSSWLSADPGLRLVSRADAQRWPFVRR